MPEQLRALVVIITLAIAVFVIARQPAIEIAERQAFARRRNLWFLLTLTAFLSHSFWIYAAIASLILLGANTREQNHLALFFTGLFAVPPAAAQIPGLGLVNYLFDLTHLRVLSLAVLLPAYFVVRRHPGTPAFGRLWADRFLGAYLLVLVILQLRETTGTDTLRQGFYVFLDVFLPYYLASRALREITDFRDALLAFVLAAFVLAAVGLFEAVRHWLLYNALIPLLGLRWGYAGYLGRTGLLRASASTGHPIALGYAMAVAIGFYLFLVQGVQSRVQRWLGGLLLAGGLVAPLSRGPWVGAAALVTTYLAIGPHAIRRLGMLALAGIASLPLLAIAPGGQKVLDMLPFIGNVEKENIDYRQRLFANSVIVIERNPWLGSVNYRQAPEMQELQQGQGIIDIVNTYLGVALESGLVGLSLFTGFFVAVLWGIYRGLRHIRDKTDECHLLGRALLATLVAILVILVTVSSITVIPIVYWSVAGVGVAYSRMVQRQAAKTTHPAA
jgi:O-antigen ligase